MDAMTTTMLVISVIASIISISLPYALSCVSCLCVLSNESPCAVCVGAAGIPDANARPQHSLAANLRPWLAPSAVAEPLDQRVSGTRFSVSPLSEEGDVADDGCNHYDRASEKCNSFHVPESFLR